MFGRRLSSGEESYFLGGSGGVGCSPQTEKGKKKMSVSLLQQWNDRDAEDDEGEVENGGSVSHQPFPEKKPFTSFFSDRYKDTNKRDNGSSLNGDGDHYELVTEQSGGDDFFGHAGDGAADSSHHEEVDRRSLHLRIASVCMSRLGHVLVMAGALAVVAFIAILLKNAISDFHHHKDFTVFYSAAVFVVLTICLSLHLIFRHLTNWYMPDVQKYVVRILWMVPLYSVQSWLSLRFHSERLYIDALRDLYEAFVIQSFLYYLVELLGGEDSLVILLRRKDAHYGDNGWLLGCLLGKRQWTMGLEFMLHCKGGVLQYVVLKTLSTIATALLEFNDLYDEGSFHFNRGYVYISFVINMSQMYALYCLVKLFHATAHDLESWSPMGKFLCVKGVVFFTWWQGLGIYLLEARGIITGIKGGSGHWENADDVANAIVDYLVCVEMLLFAIAHSYTFTHLECIPKHVLRQQQQLQEEMTGQESEQNSSCRRRCCCTSSTTTRRGGTTRRRRSSVNAQDGLENGGDFHDFGDGHEHTDDDDDEYQPPTIRTLNEPLSLKDALWSSTVPEEALQDIRRLRHGVSDDVLSRAMDPGVILMSCLHKGESI